MDNTKKYYGLIIFIFLVVVLVYGAFSMISPKVAQADSLRAQISAKEGEIQQLEGKLTVVKTKIKKIKDSIVSSQKKIYSPVEADLGNETLFFTLYNDVIEMLHANSIKIKAIDYKYNPESDAFVKFGKDVYFVCDINMEVVSNYVNLGKLIQDLYQYPYYIKINGLEVKPYAKDKKILVSNISLRLYAHTSPEDGVDMSADAPALSGANTKLPQ